MCHNAEVETESEKEKTLGNQLHLRGTTTRRRRPVTENYFPFHRHVVNTIRKVSLLKCSFLKRTKEEKPKLKISIKDVYLLTTYSRLSKIHKATDKDREKETEQTNRCEYLE